LGDPCEGLLRLARVGTPDILVMGAAARPRSVHSPVGGTAARMLERMNCDLLVLKPPGFVSPLLVTD
jgi:universal stress protein E